MSIDDRIRRELERQGSEIDRAGFDENSLFGMLGRVFTGDRVFWGVLALAALHAVSMLKLWFFMEMNRNSVIREVKRMEIALNRLER
jgi:hypothetical protein